MNAHLTIHFYYGFTLIGNINLKLFINNLKQEPRDFVKCKAKHVGHV